MKTGTSVAIIIGLSLWSLVGCSSPKWDLVEPAEFTEGLEHIEEYGFAGAESIFSKLSRMDSTAAWGNYGLGLSQESQRQWWEAVVFYSKSLDNDDSFAPAWTGMGRLYSKLGWYEKSVAAYQRAIKLGYDLPYNRTMLARQLLIGFETEAAREAVDFSEVKPVTKNWIDAISFRMAGELEKASSAATEALAQSAVDGEYNSLAADYYETAGRLDSAAYYSVAAVEASKFKPAATAAHFDRLLRYEEYDLIRQLFPKLPQTANTEIMLAQMQLDYHTARSNLYAAYGANAKYQTLKMQTVKDETYGAMIYSARIKASLADMAGTETAITKIEEFHNYHIGSPLLNDLIDDQMLRLFTLVRGAKQALEPVQADSVVRADDPDYWLLKMMIEVTSGDFDSYRKSVGEYRDRHSDSPAALSRMADMLSRKHVEYNEDAIKYYSLALEISGRFYPAFEHQVALLMRLRRFDEARALFENYPHFAEQSDLLRAKGAICCAEAGAEAESLAEFKSAMSGLGGNVFLVERYLQALWTRGHRELSLEVIDALLKALPENAEALSTSAQWLAEYGEADRALELASRASELPFATGSARVQKARALCLTGQEEKGLALFEKMGREFETDSEYSLYYSQALARDNKSPRQAGNLARSSLTKNRHTLYAFLNICQVYSSQKRVDLALGQARQTVNLFPDQPRALFAMGRAAHHEKRAEAVEALNKAIELGLHDPMLAQAKQMLKSKTN